MNFISLDNIYGKDIFLSSSYKPNKILTLHNSKIFFKKYEESNNINYGYVWNFIQSPTDSNEFIIKNKESGMCICHLPEDKGEISLIMYNTENIFNNDDLRKRCSWKIGDNSELYQDDGSEEKYLWVADNNLHVISDSYLADRWFIYNTSKSNNHPNNIIFIIISILLIFIYLVITLK